MLRILQDLVALVLSCTAFGAGVLTALGDVKFLRQPAVRLLASIALVLVGFWVFYQGIQHIVSE